MKKPFSKELHDQNDGPARARVRQSFAEMWGLNLVDNPDIFGPDLIAYRGSVFQGFVEIEVKHNWTGARFPFKTVHIPSRKERIFQHRPMIFVVMNKEMNRFIWFKLDDVVAGARVKKKTRMTNFDESFIELPCKKGHKVTCSDWAS